MRGPYKQGARIISPGVIGLTQGKVTLIDEVDLPIVAPYTWCADQSRRRLGQDIWYAQTNINGVRRRLHQLLCPGVPEVDHKNGDGLDNRRQNLREATRSQNLINQQKLPGKTSRFKGVYWDSEREKWFAYMRADGRMVALGRFDDEEEAACVRDVAVSRVWGEFARLNEVTL